MLGGLRPAIVALIACAGLSVIILSFWGTNEASLKSTDFMAVGIFAVGLFVLRKWKVNPMYIMLGSGIIGGIIYLLI